MSFPEYLKERLSEDYRNLIIQKLEEVKQQSENLKTNSFSAIDADLRGKLENELSRLKETLDSDITAIQHRIRNEMSSAIDEYVSSWYHSDIAAYQQQMELLISDIVSNVPPPPKKESSDLASLSNLISKFDESATQSEVLNVLLKNITGWVDRAVLFVLKGDGNASGWAGVGLGADMDVNKIRQLSVNMNSNHVLREAYQTGAAAYGEAEHFSDNSQLYFSLGGDFPRSAMAFPIVVRGKIAGILYSDINEELSDKPDLVHLLNLACKTAGMTIDLLPVRPKPAAKPAAVAQSSAAPSPVQTPVPTPPPAPPVEVAPPPPPEPEPQPEPEPEPETPSSVESLAAPTIPMETHHFHEEAPVEDESGGTTVVMTAPLLPPPVIAPVDQKLHDDAKRFARLLVSEIKLYNEAQVTAGREHKDLYDRLKDDIERSRRMYQERVPENIHSTTNYFYEELVRTLANGDPTLLGM
jgi:cell division septation protein DedD